MCGGTAGPSLLRFHDFSPADAMPWSTRKAKLSGIDTTTSPGMIFRVATAPLPVSENVATPTPFSSAPSVRSHARKASTFLSQFRDAAPAPQHFGGISRAPCAAKVSRRRALEPCRAAAVLGNAHPGSSFCLRLRRRRLDASALLRSGGRERWCGSSHVTRNCDGCSLSEAESSGRDGLALVCFLRWLAFCTAQT